MKLSKTSDKELSFIRALVYGDSGIGKTTSLRTLPEKNTLIILGERGAIPLRNMDFPVVTIESWEDLREIVGAIKDADETYDPKTGITITVGEEKVEGIKCIAIDSLSTIAELCIRQIVTVDRSRLIEERTKGRSDTPEGIYEEQMTMEDWGLYRTRISNLLSVMSHRPAHLIITSLAAWSENKKSGDVMRTPNLSGKLAFEFPGWFGEVFHMESAVDSEGSNTRVWRTYNDGQCLAKDESGVLAPFEMPDWSKVIGKILKKEKA